LVQFSWQGGGLACPGRGNLGLCGRQIQPLQGQRPDIAQFFWEMQRLLRQVAWSGQGPVPSGQAPEGLRSIVCRDREQISGLDDPPTLLRRSGQQGFCSWCGRSRPRLDRQITSQARSIRSGRFPGAGKQAQQVAATNLLPGERHACSS